MKSTKLNKSLELPTLIKKAADFHGHLGPFLVIGVRMGSLSKRILNVNIGKSKKELQVTAKLPLSTPFSCILDGIQATTRCTVGNGKLRMENTQGKITVHFEQQNSNNALNIHVNPQVVEELKNRFSEGASNEELAREIASMSESQLFMVEKQ